MPVRRTTGRRLAVTVTAGLAVLAVAGCDTSAPGAGSSAPSASSSPTAPGDGSARGGDGDDAEAGPPSHDTTQSEPDDADAGDAGDASAEGQADQEGDDQEITLAFAGDIHFQRSLRDLVGQEDSTLGPLSRSLREADLAVANLESALTPPRPQADKELEQPGRRYWFRAGPPALDVLGRSGVDVVSLANNHAADHGAVGIENALRAARQRNDVDVVGVGRNAQDAFDPYRSTIDGVDVAVLAADASAVESVDPAWTARPGTGTGIASARGRDTDRLLSAVRDAASTDDVVVVFMHWGPARAQCPSDGQQRLAAQLAEAGADVVVGSGSHVLQGAGMIGSTYVAYGLGDFAWYHGRRPSTGVLGLTLRGGTVVDETWAPGEIPGGGGTPRPVDDRRAAVQQWEDLRDCTQLAAVGDAAAAESVQEPTPSDGLPAYTSTVEELPAAVRRRMTGSSHDPATCPLDLDELRLVTVDRVGFDGTARDGRLVVHRDVADEVAEIFGEIYDARFPVRRMRLVDVYDANDNRSMRQNNSSAYNCRTVAGTDRFSNHAFGRAIDINPVQNPYVTPGGTQPPRGEEFRQVDRSPGAQARPGVITTGGPVMTAFTTRGWTWGADFSRPDFQHFAQD